MSHPRRALAVLAVALPLALGGPAADLPGTQAEAAGQRVVMSGYAFGPAKLTIPAGTTVTWVNQDSAPHDAKSASGPQSFHSPMLKKGATWSFAFTKPGTYNYLCTVHPDMTGSITVRAPATSAAPAPQHSHSHSGGNGQRSSGQPTSPPAATEDAHDDHEAGSRPASKPPSGTADPSVSSPAPSPVTTQAAGGTRPLEPLLLLAGVVTGIAVLCLLLVGSRSQRERESG